MITMTQKELAMTIKKTASSKLYKEYKHLTYTK